MSRNTNHSQLLKNLDRKLTEISLDIAQVRKVQTEQFSPRHQHKQTAAATNSSRKQQYIQVPSPRIHQHSLARSPKTHLQHVMSSPATTLAHKSTNKFGDQCPICPSGNEDHVIQSARHNLSARWEFFYAVIKVQLSLSNLTPQGTEIFQFSEDVKLESEFNK